MLSKDPEGAASDNVRIAPEKMLLLYVYTNCCDSENDNYFDLHGAYSENAELSALYDFLIKLGYDMSDEEKQLRDGTHRLFANEDEQ